MATTASASFNFPSVPGGAGYSVAKGARTQLRFGGQADLSHLWFVYGKSATTPTVYSDLTSQTTHTILDADASSATFDHGSSTYSGTYTNNSSPGVSGWTVGSHLWLLVFDQATTPATTDAPAVVLDLGIVVA